MHPHFEERAILYWRWTLLYGCFPSVITDVCGAAANGPRVLKNITATAQVQGETASQPPPVQNLDTANWQVGKLHGTKSMIWCLKLGYWKWRTVAQILLFEGRQTYCMLQSVVGCFGLGSVLVTDGSVLDHWFEIWGGRGGRLLSTLLVYDVGFSRLRIGSSCTQNSGRDRQCLDQLSKYQLLMDGRALSCCPHCGYSVWHMQWP